MCHNITDNRFNCLITVSLVRGREFHSSVWKQGFRLLQRFYLLTESYTQIINLLFILKGSLHRQQNVADNLFFLLRWRNHTLSSTLKDTLYEPCHSTPSSYVVLGVCRIWLTLITVITYLAYFTQLWQKNVASSQSMCSGNLSSPPNIR